ncbi:MAG: hypothetical protein U9Q88_08450 [Bacillota bacterium]|jgi:hypothetical protein|nr:hypothetical protein [Bacillota bacterium]
MKKSIQENDWKETIASFRSLHLESGEKQDVLNRLEKSMEKKKRISWVTSYTAPILSVVVIVFALLTGSYFLLANGSQEEGITSRGEIPSPRIPALNDMNLSLSQTQMDTWLIINEEGKETGKISYCLSSCDEQVDTLKVMENIELEGYIYPTTLIREHVKTIDVFQIQHYFIYKEQQDKVPFAYLQIKVPSPDHELEKQGPKILENFQQNNQFD